MEQQKKRKLTRKRCPIGERYDKKLGRCVPITVTPVVPSIIPSIIPSNIFGNVMNIQQPGQQPDQQGQGLERARVVRHRASAPSGDGRWPFTRAV